MLALDDPRWSELDHAYGPASDIPELLGDLADSTAPTTDYQEEPWYTLWSSLCHQGDTYRASYAAVPHIVEIASRCTGPIATDFFFLPAMIEISRRTDHGPAVPDFLQGAYSAALTLLLETVHAYQSYEWDRPMQLAAMTAIAAIKGDAEMAQAIANLDDDLIRRLAELDFVGIAE